MVFMTSLLRPDKNKLNKKWNPILKWIILIDTSEIVNPIACGISHGPRIINPNTIRYDFEDTKTKTVIVLILILLLR
jgi:hypothetical protein